MLLGLFRLPYELLWIAFHVAVAIADVVTGRKRRRFESTVLIKAPPDAVWRFMNVDRTVYDAWPTMESIKEPLPEGDGLMLTRVSFAGRETGRVVWRTLESDAA